MFLTPVVVALGAAKLDAIQSGFSAALASIDDTVELIGLRDDILLLFQTVWLTGRVAS